METFNEWFARQSPGHTHRETWEAAVAAERERCAKVCETLANQRLDAIRHAEAQGLDHIEDAAKAERFALIEAAQKIRHGNL
jgi:nitroreductase